MTARPGLNDCHPRLHTLPRLGWVSARAYSPNKAAAVATWPLEATHLCFQWCRGDLYASGPHAVVVVAPVHARRPVRTAAAVFVTAVMMLAVFGSLGAASTALGVLAVTHGAPGWVIDMLAPVPVLVLLIGFLSRGNPDKVLIGERSIDGVARTYPPDVQVWKAGALAAWPRGEGHGTRLLETLLDRAPDGVVLAVARDDRVRAYYERLGMRPHPENDQVLTFPHDLTLP